MKKLCLKCQVNEREEGGFHCEACDAESRAHLCFRAITADLSIKAGKGMSLTGHLRTIVENYWIKYYKPDSVPHESNWYKIFRLKVRNLLDQKDRDGDQKSKKEGL